MHFLLVLISWMHPIGIFYGYYFSGKFVLFQKSFFGDGNLSLRICRKGSLVLLTLLVCCLGKQIVELYQRNTFATKLKIQWRCWNADTKSGKWGNGKQEICLSKGPDSWTYEHIVSFQRYGRGLFSKKALHGEGKLYWANLWRSV